MYAKTDVPYCLPIEIQTTIFSAIQDGRIRWRFKLKSYCCIVWVELYFFFFLSFFLLLTRLICESRTEERLLDNKWFSQKNGNYMSENLWVTPDVQSAHCIIIRYINFKIHRPVLSVKKKIVFGISNESWPFACFLLSINPH